MCVLQRREFEMKPCGIKRMTQSVDKVAVVMAVILLSAVDGIEQLFTVSVVMVFSIPWLAQYDCHQKSSCELDTISTVTSVTYCRWYVLGLERETINDD